MNPQKFSPQSLSLGLAILYWNDGECIQNEESTKLLR